MTAQPLGSSNGAWVLSTARDDDWRDNAECRKHVGMFDDSLVGENRADQAARHEAAIRICDNVCTVRAQCRAEIVYGKDEGVLGGKRVRLPVLKPHRQAEIVHGTERGATQHRRRGEPICRPCAQASKRAHQDRDRKAAEREAAKEAARNAPRLPCGSYEAYNQHRSRGENIDDPCRLARNEHDRAIKASRGRRAS